MLESQVESMAEHATCFSCLSSTVFLLAFHGQADIDIMQKPSAMLQGRHMLSEAAMCSRMHVFKFKLSVLVCICSQVAFNAVVQLAGCGEVLYALFSCVCKVCVEFALLQCSTLHCIVYTVQH